ncbi:hypothetical protein BRC79_04995 [Halobacteriales archaeon QH_8_67_27]|nr:MAG: hypothetical protein BRC79_04995 [Halobacteriales archaeon QH_8_67_27]
MCLLHASHLRPNHNQRSYRRTDSEIRSLDGCSTTSRGDDSETSIRGRNLFTDKFPSVAVTARSTGDELVVADGDFETDALEDAMQVTNLRT